MRQKILVLATLLILWATAWTPARAAETSQTIAFHGCDATLIDTADLRLRLFDAGAGGNMVFEETQAGVTVDATNCITVGIGNVTPLAAALFAANPSLWAAFALDATPDTELGAGRTPITANGYAFRALNADQLGGMPASGYLPATGGSLSGSSDAPIVSVTNATLVPGTRHSESVAAAVASENVHAQPNKLQKRSP